VLPTTSKPRPALDASKLTLPDAVFVSTYRPYRRPAGKGAR